MSDPTPPAGQAARRSCSTLLVEDDFRTWCPTRWRVEAQHPATRVHVDGGRLLIDSPEGVTVWLTQALDGSYRIEFERQVLVEGGANDRLSDLNQFWAARDPRNPDLFTRAGALAEYDALDLYYVGMGGNANSTTRFRRYDGSGERRVLAERLGADDLLEAGRRYAVRIDVRAGGTGFWVDGRCLFEAAHDGLPDPGHFAFRSVHSRQAIHGFRVTRLD